jgi:hypothetical protein
MDPELREMCTEQLQYRPGSGPDPRTGQSVLGDPVNVHGKVEQFARVVADKEGRSVMANTRVIVLPQADDGGDVTISLNGQLILPPGYSPQSPPMISVGRENDPQTGEVDHWQVYL